MGGDLTGEDARHGILRTGYGAMKLVSNLAGQSHAAARDLDETVLPESLNGRMIEPG